MASVGGSNDADLDSLSEAELIRLLDDIDDQADRLREERGRLRTDIRLLTSDAEDQQAAAARAKQRAGELAVLVGQAPARGPGVRITLYDREDRISPITVLATIHELRDAGAEAISVADQRVTTSTYVSGRAGELSINGRATNFPLQITAIGEPETLAAALHIRGGVIATVTASGGACDVDTVDDLIISVVAPQRGDQNPAGSVAPRVVNAESG